MEKCDTPFVIHIGMSVFIWDCVEVASLIVLVVSSDGCKSAVSDAHVALHLFEI